MDLIGKRPRNGYVDYHLNWTGWKILCDLLEILHCDLSELRGSNDGAPVKAATSRSFAKAIREAINNNRLTRTFIKDDMYSTGGYEGFALVKTNTKQAKKLYEDLNINKLSDEDTIWLYAIANFFENCGGFRQW